MFTYYRPSGAVPPIAVLFMLGGGMISAIVLSAVYVLCLWFIPFVYLNFILTIFYAAGIGQVLSLSVRAGKLRNPGAATLVSLIIAFAAVYSAHAAWATLVQHAGQSQQALGSSKLSYLSTSFTIDSYVDNLLSPGYVWRTIRLVSLVGLWSFFGITASGWILWTIWFCEACIIVFVSVSFPLVQSRKPFSELDMKWIKGIKGTKLLLYPGKIMDLEHELETGQYDRLLQAEIAQAGKTALRLVFYEDHPQQLFYLEVDVEESKNDEESKASVKKGLAGSIDFVVVPAAVYSQLLARVS